MTTPEQPPELPHDEDLSLHADIRQAFESEAGPSPRARQAVMARLNAEQPISVQPNNEIGGLFTRLVDWLRVPATPRWAPAAALLLALVPTGLLLRQAAEPNGNVPTVTTRGLGDSPTRLTARFNPQATEAQIRGLLVTLGAHIVDGPGAAGDYVMELAATDPQALSQKINAARAHPEILQSLELAAP
jgi:hypothetical protein